MNGKPVLLEIVRCLWHNKRGYQDTAVEGGRRGRKCFHVAPKEQA